MDGIRGRFTLTAAQRIAAERLEEMQSFLDRLEEDSFGHL